MRRGFASLASLLLLGAVACATTTPVKPRKLVFDGGQDEAFSAVLRVVIARELVTDDRNRAAGAIRTAWMRGETKHRQLRYVILVRENSVTVTPKLEVCSSVTVTPTTEASNPRCRSEHELREHEQRNYDALFEAIHAELERK